MKTIIERHAAPVRTLFSDPSAGRELMRRIAAPRKSWWRRWTGGRPSLRRATLGRETVISDR